MSNFIGFLPRLISTLAIRSWRDLIWKVLGLCLAIILIGLPVSYLRDPNAGSSVGFWGVILISGVVLLVQLAALTYLGGHHVRLRETADTDDLTGLWNRRAFVERTMRIRQKTPEAALFFLDVDHFRRINDTYGHNDGDWCLRAVAEALVAHTSKGDVIGRMCGDEFAVYMPAAKPKQIAQFGDAMTQIIMAEMRDRFAPAKPPIALTLSVGIALAHENKGFDVLLRQADEALYEAKVTGRAKMVVWTADVMKPEIARAS